MGDIEYLDALRRHLPTVLDSAATRARTAQLHAHAFREAVAYERC